MALSVTSPTCPISSSRIRDSYGVLSPPYDTTSSASTTTTEYHQKVREQFEKNVGQKTKVASTLPKQISQKKVSLLQTASTFKSSLSSEINKKLFIDKNHTKTIDKTTNTLETTMLKCSCNLEDNELKYIADHFPNLTHLDLCHCSNLTDIGLSYLQNLSSLQHLDLCFSFDPSSYSPNITNEGLSYLAKLPLRYLDLDCFYDITDETIALFKECPLEYLCINECKISDAGLSYLSHFQSMKTLTMHSCKNITDEGLDSLRKLPLLENLDLHWCEKLSNPLQKYFRDKAEIQQFFFALDEAEWIVV